MKFIRYHGRLISVAANPDDIKCTTTNTKVLDFLEHDLPNGVMARLSVKTPTGEVRVDLSDGVMRRIARLVPR